MTTNYITLNNDVLTTNDTGSHCYLKPHDSNMRRISKAEYTRIVEEDKQAREQRAADQEIREGLERVLSNAKNAELTEEAVEEAIRSHEESVESEGVREAAREAQAQGKQRKTPKKRIPKNVEYHETLNGVEVILTEKQLDFMFHLPDTCYWEHGVDSQIWIDCLCDDIKGQFKGKPMTVGAMISTLCEKGIGTRWKEKVNGRKATAFALTELGKLVAKDLGL